MKASSSYRLGFVLAIGVIAAVACDRGESQSTAQGDAGGSAEEAGYVAPPALTAATRTERGVVLSGRAPATAEVRLASPQGQVYTAAAPDGRWTLRLPTPATPAMFAFMAELDGRTIRGEGAVLVAPPPGPAALVLRPGFGAASVGTGAARPSIVAVDYDASGGAAVAGLAAPNAAVRLSVDGTPAGIGQADAAGHFSVMALNRTLAPGERRIDVETPGGRAQVRVTASAPEPLGGAAYRAVRQPQGWRIDWAPPGGGVQTSLVFDAPGAAP